VLERPAVGVLVDLGDAFLAVDRHAHHGTGYNQ
jgi:hypothetical protein